MPAIGLAESLSEPARSILKATAAAAAGSMPLVGAGDKNAVDGLAVDAMRAALVDAGFGGVVAIGEGEKDEAPMLFNGEVIGDAEKVEWDIAVDPIDGTALAAKGVEGAVSVMAASPRGTLMADPNIYFMHKLVASSAGKGVLDIRKSATENIQALAVALGKPVTEMGVAVINKPRNYGLIEEVQAAGAKWVRFDEGDVAMAVAAVIPGTGVDMLVGLGGNPEGAVTACAIRVMNGFMQGQLATDSPEEAERAIASGSDLDRVWELDELAGGDHHVFVISGITDGVLARGVREFEGGYSVESLVIDSNLDEPLLIETFVAG